MRHKLIFWVVVIISFFALFPRPVLAATVSVTNYPSSKIIGEEFIVQFNAEGLSPGTYYGKVRMGKYGTTPNKGETKNGEEWFQDSGDSWSKFPLFSTDGSGTILSGSLTARARNTAEIGENIMYIRLNNGKNYDSSEVIITLEQAPVSTSTPTSTPIPSSTSTPTKTPTPTPTSKPTPIKSGPTATPKVTQSPSSTPTSTVTPTIPKMAVEESFEEEKEDIGPTAILGEMVVVSPSALPTEIAPKPEKSFLNFPTLSIGIGFIFLTVSGILAFRSYKKSQGYDYR